MGAEITPLPTWFDWEDYRSLYDSESPLSLEEWIAQFFARSKGYHPKNEEPIGGYLIDPEFPYFTEVLNRSDPQKTGLDFSWENGILCYGHKGKDTHEYLQDTVFHFAALYGGEFRAERSNDQGAVSTTAYNHYTKTHGYFVFPDQESFENFDRQRKVNQARTFELAVNLSAPKSEVLAQFEKLFDDHAKQFSKGSLKYLGKRKTNISESRVLGLGLAIHDLMQDGIQRHAIEKQVLPLWHGESSLTTKEQGGSNENYGSNFKYARKAVSDLINGGWRKYLFAPGTEP